MLARIHTAALDGLEVQPLTVEVDVRDGLPSLTIVGLGDRAARETGERLRAATSRSGFIFPQRRITIKVSGARRTAAQAPGIDLPIAIGFLAATGQVPVEAIRSTTIVGDLGLDGRLGAIRGALQIAEQAEQEDVDALMVPAGNLAEAAIAPGLRVLAPATLSDAVTRLLSDTSDDRRTAQPRPEPDLLISMDDIHGFEAVKTALADAVAASAATLLVGPRGSGRTMLARRAATLMPRMDDHERLQVTRISSACGIHDDYGMVNERPFRAPHHSTSLDGLLGTWARPGEVTLAHHGVLYIDEITAFKPELLYSLRSAVRRGYEAFARDDRVRRMPASPLLIGSTSGCLCGGAVVGECRCSPQERGRYELQLDLVRGLFDREILVTR